MQKVKIGTIFIVAFLALAGLGISYAGLTDTIHIFGTVKTATVEFEIIEYSGTWVYKVWGEGAPTDEVIITYDPDYDPSIDYPNCQSKLISYAVAREPTAADPEEYDVIIEFDNLFPCIDFIADIEFKIGTIPVKVDYLDYGALSGEWMQPLIDSGDIWATMHDQDGDIIVLGSQIHPGDVITLEVHFHLVQDDIYQGKTGSGYCDIGIIQWNDMCEEEETETDISVVKTVNNRQPYIGDDVIYTVEATNIGNAAASNIVIEDNIPNGLTYEDHTAPAGSSFDQDAGPGDNEWGTWYIDSLGIGETASLTIIASIDVGSSTDTFTQLAMILDGSGSIGSSDFGIMKEGLATAIETYVPHNGMVELTVVHFAGYYANLEVGPIIITDDPIDPGYYTTVANLIRGIPYRGGYTPLACGLHLAADTLKNSPDYDADHRQVINIVTDGVPNIDSDPTSPYTGVYVGADDGKIAAEAAMTYLLDTLAMTSDGVSFGGDEVDVEAIDFPTAAYTWLKTNIVWPQPANEDWPPTAPGWIRSIDTYDEFAQTIKEKFQIVFEGIENCAELIDSTPVDINPTNDKSCIVITPQPTPTG